ncbi:MAG: glycoside hydrolase family 2 TIM barrel-domain containing protein, partial [Clostridia bacterium]|nr:glycoside hydrolase family 2 TIM barrel-domain containing protein [Clostridia bacterium]
NAVRTAGYPPHPIFAELCDISGIYLIPEAEIETNGTWYSPFYRPNLISGKRKWASTFLDRTQRLYHTFKNQASVIMWSLGNDSGGQLCQDICYEWLKKVSALPVQYEGVINSKRKCYDVLSLKNNDISRLPGVLQKVAKEENVTGKPVFLCEYAYAAGNGRGGLHEYVRAFFANENFMGGCVWRFADQSVRMNGKKLTGDDFDGYIHDGWLCEDGIFGSDRAPHPSAEDLKHVYRPLVSKLLDNGTLELFNRNYFTDTSDIKIMLRVYIDGKEISRTQLDAVIPPQKSRKFDVFLGFVQGDMFLNVEYIGKNDGKIIAIEQHKINMSLPDTETAEKGRIKVVDRNGILTVHFTSGYMRMDKNRGSMLNFVINGTEYLEADPARMGTGCFATNILRPAAVGASAGDEIINVVPSGFSYKLRDDGKGNAAAVEIQINNEFYIGDKESYITQDMYVLYAGGKMEVYSTLHPRRKNLPPLQCFGKLIKMAPEFSDITYYGRGPVDNYPDANEYAQIGIFSASAKDFAHKYTKPQEAGNRCDTRFALIRNAKSEGLLFLALAKPFNFKVRMHPKWCIDASRRNEDLPKSDGVYVHIDGYVSGVSSSAAYSIPADESYVMGFCVVPYNSTLNT